MAEERKSKSNVLFRQVIEGKDPVSSLRRSKLFLEAICAQTDPTVCISKLISSSSGISALQQSLRLDLSHSCFNQTVCNLLDYFQAPQLEVVCNGDLLRRLIGALVEPPIFWDAFAAAAQTGVLIPRALHCFAWMLFQLVTQAEPASKRHVELALSDAVQRILKESSRPDTRNLYHKVRHILTTVTIPAAAQGSLPGGRHDNDFEDFRQIQIMPTVDELSSREPPFLRFATEVDTVEAKSKFAVHLDNQFRLLREDMLHDLRESLQATSNRMKNRKKGQVIDGLRLVNVEWDPKCRQKWALVFECTQGLWMLPQGNTSKREQFLKDHRKVLANESLVCLLAYDNVVGFGFIWRKETSLAQTQPMLHLHLPDSEIAVRRTLTGLRGCDNVQILQLSTATFAYQPILQQLQAVKMLPLADKIMLWSSKDQSPGLGQCASPTIARFAEEVATNPSLDLQDRLSLPQPTVLDAQQGQSLQACLTQEVALIQGPPGTGKSFIGALITKALYSLTQSKILVLSYTNHALDQFLEDLLSVNIAPSDIVRLGSAHKASIKTKILASSEQRGPQYNLSRPDWEIINSEVAKGAQMGAQLADALRSYNVQSAKKVELLEYLEFSSEFGKYFDAFEVSLSQDGFQVMAENGKPVNRYYLLDRWAKGLNAGVLASYTTNDTADIWSLTHDARQLLLKNWLEDIFGERLQKVCEYSEHYNAIVANVKTIFGEKDRRIMAEKRIIGCTTTAAAKYVSHIQGARPDVIVVEEAGEILESHVITALGPATKQLILIGDHKQLRPKAHYHLSVEKGTGYDLNRSLFERLILQNYPHHTLSEQHRMRPEISALVRALTYPELQDAAKTRNRPQLRGFQSSVIFVNHTVAETEGAAMYDPREGGSTSSKTNQFEAEMTLKCVRYLAQQGYGSDQVVVLTPYLGQLRLLFDILRHDSDPVLNDMDTYDLVRAGLMPAATASMQKRQLRISTIDNYQGEESDVVVVSLTRSNPRGDIGFLDAPERLNVLISRARNGLIMIGSADTFLKARKGKELWAQFFALLKDASHVFDGFPTRCERHPRKQALISEPTQFDTFCPDGGCDEPCQAQLSCGVHTCPQKCHQLFDHSKIRCERLISDKCATGHSISYPCYINKPPPCKACEHKKARDEKKRQADHERRQAELAARIHHEQMMQAIDDQIDQLRHNLQQTSVRDERQKAFEQKLVDLENTTKLATADAIAGSATSQASSQNVKSNLPFNSVNGTSPGLKSRAATSEKTKSRATSASIPKSEAESEWEHRKGFENRSNEALDELMRMTGLQRVKLQFLNILDKIDTSRRQNTSLKDERLGIVLLGNPGTGKTTVARLYAKFLATLDVLSGTKFVETTGTKLANDGVGGTKILLADILQAGGGAFFIDEAYQLTSGNNHGGAAVLDFLLAEIENTTGKVVFMFAGYEKQMEKFFMHNPGLDSRIPNKLHFADYSEAELHHMLQRKIEKKWKGSMSIEDGPLGLYMRIVIRRLHRQSGREGFGNARALENVFDKIKTSQASRLARERRNGIQPDDFVLTKADMIGPEPTQALVNCTAWQELRAMIGLDTVKQSVQNILDRLQQNYKRELKELQPVDVSLNRLFLGSPGTGKTTVARLYGQILSEIGVLSTSECILKTPADFIGSVLGESERNTKNILDATKGKVLVIDEAYMFYHSAGSHSNSASDNYRTAVVDTLVSEVQSTPGEDRAVLLLGYREQMETMLRKVNPGLARRFPVDGAFAFEDYNDAQLSSILDLKLQKQGLSATPKAKDIAISVLAKARRKVNFGNAGAVENLLSKAKESFNKRQQTIPDHERTEDVLFEPQDFDEDFARSKDAVANCKELFKDAVGCDDVIAKLLKYIQSAENARRLGLDPEELIPFTFLFKGPPGTGKTTTARKIGQVFYDMGFLSSNEVVECSATDFVGQYMGQTGPKVIEKLDEALGKVLFIDEAYRLGEGDFAKQAIDELVDCLTKLRYKGKMIVILAGYEAEINDLIRVNPGLSSRFREEIIFKDLTADKCLELFINKCERMPKVKLAFDAGSLEGQIIVAQFQTLIELPVWGNGRDVETLYKGTMRHILGTRVAKSDHLEVTSADVLHQLNRMKTEQIARIARHHDHSTTRANDTALAAPARTMAPSPDPPPSSSSAVKAIGSGTDGPVIGDQSREETEKEQRQEKIEPGPSERDADVPEDVWQQLQLDARHNTHREVEAEQAITNTQREQKRLASEARRLESEAEHSQQKMRDDSATAAERAEADEARRRHEQLRLQAAAARRKADEESQRLQKLKEEAERERRREAQAQEKLRRMGVCPAGFRWIRQGDGYRCAGGSHFVGHEQLGLGS